MTGTSSISSVISSTDQQVEDRAATFEKVAAAIPDRIDGEQPEIVNAAGVAIAPAPASDLKVSRDMVGNALASVFNVAAELLQEPAMQLADKERGELAELWEEPVNRIIKKHLGETENGDLWLAAGCTFMVLASKSERIRAIVSKITGGSGSITPDSSASPTAVNRTAPN